jgi:pimeloyl-ACP methyl ester carboxylesterase
VKSGGQRFPLSSLAQYPAQLVPNIEVTLVGGATNKINDLAPLLDKIGAAIVIVHSQSGVMGLGAVIKRPKLIKGLISVEGSCEPVADADLPTYAKVPPMEARAGSAASRLLRSSRTQAASRRRKPSSLLWT